MRLFTALDIPPGPLGRLEALVARLAPLAPLRWSRTANLHITTKFVGEWPAERLEELKAALAALPAAGPIHVDLSGVGWFPNPHQPRIFWAAVKAGPALAELARATSAALAALGVLEEDRPFQPHLTLARIKPPLPDLLPLRRAIAGLPDTEFGGFAATAFHLYLSEPAGGHSKYTRLASFPLQTS